MDRKIVESPKPLPPAPSVQDQILSAYEMCAGEAVKKIRQLINSSKDEIALKAALAVIEKLTPDKFANDYDFLKHKSREELVGIIIGSGLLEKIESQEQRIVEGEVVPNDAGGVAEPREGDNTNSGKSSL